MPPQQTDTPPRPPLRPAAGRLPGAPRRRRRRGGPRWPWIALVVAVLVAAGVVAYLVDTGGGGDGGSGASAAPSGYHARGTAEKARVPEQWRRLALAMARPWPTLQIKSGPQAGRFPDYTDRFIKGFPLTRYGESVLGYALVQTGVREGEDRLIDSGLRALAYVANRPAGTHHRASVFEDMAMAAAYNFVRRQIPDHPLFRKNRAAWENFLRRIRPVSTPYRVPETSRYSNHFLVEAIGILELLKTGLRSSRPGATLGGKRELATAVTYRLLNEQIPGFAAEDQVRVRGEPAFILSDRPDNPLAYHGFSIGFYGRALRLLGRNDSPTARSALRGAVNASLWLTGPDGDSAYWGRSQEESWALSATANGAETAARLAGSSGRRDARYQALAQRALTRLRNDYHIGPDGLLIVPALRKRLSLGTRGVDVNAGGPSFAGVTLMNLNWALEQMPARPRIGRIGADRDKAVTLSKGESQFAVVRKGDVWFAVRKTFSARRKEDLRYDFGLVALQGRSSAGWHDILRIRPRQLTGRDSVGPTMYVGNEPAFPYGTSISTSASGTVTVTGGFKTAARQVVRPDVVFRYEPVSCGVRIAWPAQAGDVFEYSTFMRRRSQPRRLSPFAIADRDQQVRFNTPAEVRFKGAYSSAVDPSLVRARAFFTLKQAKSMKVTICRR